MAPWYYIHHQYIRLGLLFDIRVAIFISQTQRTMACAFPVALTQPSVRIKKKKKKSVQDQIRGKHSWYHSDKAWLLQQYKSRKKIALDLRRQITCLNIFSTIIIITLIAQKQKYNSRLSIQQTGCQNILVTHFVFIPVQPIGSLFQNTQHV